ncbi:Truncated transposase [Estrella lausannensis]|uniref:Truncated transposase n=1 Tax=Estrella lausannensis TaxID=483423 RepID=A0A0H5DSC4_9BACT|nr:Truncated transposase [Estrella lausannensis]
MQCPECGSEAFKKNGYTRHGKQNHRCLDCGRQFSCDETEDTHPEVNSDLGNEQKNREIQLIS